MARLRIRKKKDPCSERGVWCASADVAALGCCAEKASNASALTWRGWQHKRPWRNDHEAKAERLSRRYPLRVFQQNYYEARSKRPFSAFLSESVPNNRQAKIRRHFQTCLSSAAWLNSHQDVNADKICYLLLLVLNTALRPTLRSMFSPLSP